MALQKVKDSMRTTTALDSTKLSGAVPAAALTNVDLVEGTKGADIASAGTMVIGTDGGYFDITGTTGITAMTVAAGRIFTLQFDGAVTLTHSSTLYLSGAANFTTEANDHMTFVSVAANNVRQIGTGLKDGGSPVVAAGGAWNLIGTAVASSSATLTITGLDSTYDTYAIAISDMHPVDASVSGYIRFGDSSGIDTGASDYSSFYQLISSGSYSGSGSATTSSIYLNYQTGEAAGEGMGALMYLHRPGDGSTRPMISGTQLSINASGAQTGGVIMGSRNAVITLDRVQFLFATGDIVSGRMTVWGIAHA